MAGRQAVKAYLDLVSQACRAVLIFLKDDKIPHTVENIAIRKGQHKTTISPNSTSCKNYDLDNGLPLDLFSLRAYNVPDHWYPKLPEKRA
ncbi:hypothetical protein QQF64_026564 [Cirrhinus molitorella]|uniref:Uncharacterized protein n=1 Tax=Cirrhinus molitorella TaxID=172907 RepID=A0ABR3N9X7_9TELE